MFSSFLAPVPRSEGASKPLLPLLLPVLQADTLVEVDVRKRGIDPLAQGVVVGAIAAIIGMLTGMFCFVLI